MAPEPALHPQPPPTRAETLFSVVEALEQLDAEDAERVIRAAAAYFGVDLVEHVLEEPATR